MTMAGRRLPRRRAEPVGSSSAKLHPPRQSDTVRASSLCAAAAVSSSLTNSVFARSLSFAFRGCSRTTWVYSGRANAPAVVVY
jgi:hypothetical protein